MKIIAIMTLRRLVVEEYCWPKNGDIKFDAAVIKEGLSPFSNVINASSPQCDGADTFYSNLTYDIWEPKARVTLDVRCSGRLIDARLDSARASFTYIEGMDEKDRQTIVDILEKAGLRKVEE